MNKKNKKFITIIRTGSAIGRSVDQYRTLVGLGLKSKIGSMKMLEDTPSVRGMVNKVKHLVRVEKDN